MTDPESPDPTRRFFGWLLLIVGVLLMTLCGVCTLFFGGMSIIDIVRTGGHEGEFSSQSILRAAAIIGLPPTFVGVVLIWWGLRLRRRAGTR